MNEPAPKPHDKLPGNGFLGWLGRQVAHVRNALKTNVSDSTTIYRDCKIEEQTLPQDPSIKLRRTVIDEVVVDRDSSVPANKKGL